MNASEGALSVVCICTYTDEYFYFSMNRRTKGRRKELGTTRGEEVQMIEIDDGRRMTEAQKISSIV